MYKQINNLVKGPFVDEAEFKAALVKKFGRLYPQATVYEVENEEKEPGFPDLLMVAPKSPAVFTEVKISDKKGVITFRPTQPPWYKRNLKRNVLIQVIAWDRVNNRAVLIDPQDVVDSKSLTMHIDGETVWVVDAENSRKNVEGDSGGEDD